MTPPRTMIGSLAGWGWLAHPWRRRAILLLLCVVLALLALYPARYRAVVALSPQNSNTAGLASILSQLGGNYAALLGNQQPIEIDLTVARSASVALDVVRRLQLGDRTGGGVLAGQRLIAGKVSIRALRGSIVEISATDHDGEFATRLVAAMASATQDRLAVLSRAQTDYKRKLLTTRLGAAQARLSRAEDAVNAFRRQYGLPDPTVQASASVGTLAGLEAQLKAKQVELAAARQFATDENMQVKGILTQMATIRGQIAAASSREPSQSNAAGLTERALQYEGLRRELIFSQTLFDAYTRYLEGAAIENLTADFNMQTLEPAHLDPERQFNLLFLGLLGAVVLIGIALEFYVISPRVTYPRAVAA